MTKKKSEKKIDEQAPVNFEEEVEVEAPEVVVEEPEAEPKKEKAPKAPERVVLVDEAKQI